MFYEREEMHAFMYVVGICEIIKWKICYDIWFSQQRHYLLQFKAKPIWLTYVWSATLLMLQQQLLNNYCKNPSPIQFEYEEQIVAHFNLWLKNRFFKNFTYNFIPDEKNEISSKFWCTRTKFQLKTNLACSF